MPSDKLGVGIVGCGLIGTRRAAAAAQDARTQVRLAVDTDAPAARELASRHGAAASADAREACSRDDIAIVVVATPNAYQREIACAALAAGKHVLVEKPMGATLEDARAIADAAAHAGMVLKAGFNHRYHGALMKTRELFASGAFGSLVNIRARYGHGGRPGYEREWRADARYSGGGELTDQGSHLIDLASWFGGAPREAFAYMQTAVWPIAPLEDNAFGLLRFEGNVVASLHASWTQWKNLFSFEIFGTEGALSIEGLGGSYGPEKLSLARRNPEGGAPSMQEFSFPEDHSWQLEWEEFLGAILDGKPYWGTPTEGLMVMQTISALYESARSGMPVKL